MGIKIINGHAYSKPREIKWIKHLKKSGGIGNVVSESSLSSNANLILIDWCLLSRLFHSLISIHAKDTLQRKISQTTDTEENRKLTKTQQKDQNLKNSKLLQ